MELFGLNISRIKTAENKSAGIVAPKNDDGATIITSTGASYAGVQVIDIEGAIRNEAEAIRIYRELASYPEVDKAIMDIIDEAIPHEDDTHQIDIILEDQLDFSDELKETIKDEFAAVLNILDFGTMASDIFKKWYVDGRLYYQILVDKDNLKRGIIELRPIESTKIKKIREVKKVKSPAGVDVISEIDEYFIFNELGIAQSSTLSGFSGIKLSTDSILYIPSGQWDVSGQVPQGYLQKAIRPINQLRMMEDAVVINRMARAPERRLFNVDCGNLPKAKADQHLKDTMNQYRNKIVYNSTTGEIKNDKKYISMLEDYWVAKRDGGKGTEITTLPGATNLDQISDVTLFQQKVWDALNVPLSRMTGDTGFNLGRTSEISRDELKFQKFIDKLRRRFSGLLYDALKTQLILKGICNDLEWSEMKNNIHFRFQRDNYFSELKNLDILQARMAIMPQIDPYLGKYFSKEWVQKNILQFTDEDILEMDEQIENEAGDKTAQPSFAPNMMDPSQGGDPSGGAPFPVDGGSGMPPPIPGQQDQPDNTKQ